MVGESTLREQRLRIIEACPTSQVVPLFPVPSDSSRHIYGRVQVTEAGGVAWPLFTVSECWSNILGAAVPQELRKPRAKKKIALSWLGATLVTETGHKLWTNWQQTPDVLYIPNAIVQAKSMHLYFLLPEFALDPLSFPIRCDQVTQWDSVFTSLGRTFLRVDGEFARFCSEKSLLVQLFPQLAARRICLDLRLLPPVLQDLLVAFLV